MLSYLTPAHGRVSNYMYIYIFFFFFWHNNSIRKHECKFITIITIQFGEFFQSWLSSSDFFMLNTSVSFTYFNVRARLSIFDFRLLSDRRAILIGRCVCMCVCVFGFNVAFNNFSVISRRCLVATGSSMLTIIVLPHWSIMSQTLDMIPHPVTLSWHWVDQS